MIKRYFAEGQIEWPSDFFERLKPLIGLVIAGVVYFILYRFKLISIPCPFKLWTSLFIKDGLTCPGCGITRMLSHEFKLEFRQAFAYNQAVFILQPFLIFEIGKLMLCYLFDKKAKYSKFENVLIILCGIFLIVFCIWRNIKALS